MRFIYATVVVVILVLPWLLGAWFFVVWKSRRLREGGSIRVATNEVPLAFSVGVGGVLGYFILGLVFQALSYISEGDFRVWLTVLLSLGAVCTSLKIISDGCLEKFYEVLRNKFGVAVVPETLIYLMIYGTQVYLICSSPLFSWDALNHWAANAVQWLSYDGEGAGPAFNAQYYKHSSPLVQLFGWSSWVSLRLNNSVAGIPWALCGLSIALMGAGLVQHSCRDPLMAKATFIVLSSIPLLSSHIMVFGYAEIWVSALFIASAGFLIFGVDLRNVKYCFMFFSLSLLVLCVKNTGLVYTASLWFASLMYATRRSPFIIIVTISLGAACIACIAWLGVSLDFLGLRINFTPDTQRLAVGGHSMIVKLYNLLEVLEDQYVAMLANHSFSILFSVQIILAVGLCTGLYVNKRSCAEIYLIGVSWTLLIVLFIGQLTLHYVNRVAEAGSDVGFSRTLLPFVVLAVPCWFSTLAFSLRRHQQPNELFSKI